MAAVKDQRFLMPSEHSGAATTVGKSGKNPMFKSEYTTLGDVLTALANLGDLVSALSNTCTTALMTTVVHLESGESYSSAMTLHPEKQTPQSLIACVTYYRRVQLMTMFGLNADDDDGNLASGDSGPSLAAGAPRPVPHVPPGDRAGRPNDIDF